MCCWSLKAPWPGFMAWQHRPAVKIQAASLIGTIFEDQLTGCWLQSNINCPFPRSHSQAISLHLWTLTADLYFFFFSDLGHCRPMSSSPWGQSQCGLVRLINLLDWNSQNIWKPRSVLPLIPLMEQHQNWRGWGRRRNLCFQLREYSIPQTAPCTPHLSLH